MEKFAVGFSKKVAELPLNTPDEAEQARMLTEQSTRTEESNREYAKQLHKRSLHFTLGADTYAMAFKALHWKSAQSLNLNPSEVLDAFHSAVIVTSI